MNTIYTFDPAITSHESATKSFHAPKSVHVKGTFNEEMAEKFAKELDEAAQTGQDIVPVVIDSFGGSVHSLMPMLDAIEACPAKVATIVSGKAMSCGALLAAAGKRGLRFITELSTVMVHEVAVGDWAKITEFKATAAEADALNKILFGKLDEFAHQTPGYFMQLVHDAGHADLFMRPTDVVAHGLADHIGMPRWEVGVKVTRKLTW